MAAIDRVTAFAPQIERLTPADIEGCLALSREAGWNQTGTDWLLFLERGMVFGCRDAAARVIATAALLPYPPAAWISLVLVTAAARRQGLANRLMGHVIGAADDLGLTPYLDATPAGAKVYTPLGFRDTGVSVTRMRRAGAQAEASQPTGTGLDGLLAADVAAMGFGRAPVLASMAARPGSRIHAAEGCVAMVRDGDRARHIGPVYARQDADVAAFLDALLQTERGAMIIDCVGAHAAVAECLARHGFVAERGFLRMRRGVADGARGAAMIACAGPEYG